MGRINRVLHQQIGDLQIEVRDGRHREVVVQKGDRQASFMISGVLAGEVASFRAFGANVVVSANALWVNGAWHDLPPLRASADGRWPLSGLSSLLNRLGMSWSRAKPAEVASEVRPPAAPAPSNHVRWTVRRDLDSIKALETRDFTKPRSGDEFLELIRQKWTVGWVYEDGEKIDGYALVQQLRDEKRVVIDTLSFPAGKEEVGQALLDRALKSAAQRGWRVECTPREPAEALRSLLEENEFTLGEGGVLVCDFAPPPPPPEPLHLVPVGERPVSPLSCRWLIRRDLATAVELDRRSNAAPMTVDEFTAEQMKRTTIGMVCTDGEERLLAYCQYDLEAKQLVLRRVGFDPSLPDPREGIVKLLERLEAKLTANRPQLVVRLGDPAEPLLGILQAREYEMGPEPGTMIFKRDFSAKD